MTSKPIDFVNGAAEGKNTAPSANSSDAEKAAALYANTTAAGKSDALSANTTNEKENTALYANRSVAGKSPAHYVNVESSSCRRFQQPRPPTHRIGELALEAMLVEVSVTPKPGLVDRNNSGSHSDMDFFTFMKSAASLRTYFDDCALTARKLEAVSDILPALRKIGLDAETDMFNATGGINTHKGEIFSLGILSGCAGYLAEDFKPVTADILLKLTKLICSGLCEHDFAQTRTKSPELLTKGERVYLEYGISGVRGEAENGYPIVRNYGLPALRKYLSDGLTLNDALAFTLIHIMAENSDTNIIARHDLNTAKEVMQISHRLIDEGLTIEKIRALDDEFISRNISPSGSADLLAVTYFLRELERLYTPA
ncbi:MAG: triphosphoribosyl-dephospho-CoA synthase CitG [Synergistaceae bacterium]|nr:triphosphoribosyl-dephospho-CoA synthase CitG [Synergistaceae bacterium]